MAGVTFSMKNMYGVVERPSGLHADGCNPGVADLNCIPVIREKVRFTIGDAMSSVYRRRAGLPSRASLVSQCAHRGRGSRGPRSHCVADDRAQARRGWAADAGSRGQAAALHRHRCRCGARLGRQRSASASIWWRFSCSNLMGEDHHGRRNRSEAENRVSARRSAV